MPEGNMHRVTEISFLVWAVSGVVAGSASAESIPPTRVFLSSWSESPAVPLVALGDGASPDRNPAGMDYAVFVSELAAFVTKEVLSDSSDEYRESPLGSHLSRGMPEQHSAFGSHCLTVVTGLRSALPSMPGSVALEDSPSPVDYAVRTGTVLLMFRQIWSAFRNDVEGNRSGFSLNPKVSARKVGINLTFHW